MKYLKIVFFLVIFVSFVDCFSLSDKNTIENLCSKFCINDDLCTTNGNIKMCNLPVNDSLLTIYCEKSQLFCDRPWVQCKRIYSEEYGFGYECKNYDSKQHYYFKNHKEILNVLEAAGISFIVEIIISVFVFLLVCCFIFCICYCFKNSCRIFNFKESDLPNKYQFVQNESIRTNPNQDASQIDKQSRFNDV
ncbi:unnamed protein product [Brachionus calyciflorus]|uniref:Uncharacterized protein n=1 Tax=Brachionus calyciflorus TaxID=104777 RepID=A0A814FPN4_9BILA|nr:unnamed protein product [Brachionus calyciflorus]